MSNLPKQYFALLLGSLFACSGGAPDQSRPLSETAGGGPDSPPAIPHYVTEAPWNAKCDGNTNDTTAIAQAISDICGGNTGGGTVVIPVGVCMVNPTLTALPIPSNCKIMGVNRFASIIRVLPNVGNYFAVFYNPTPNSNITFENFTIDQNAPNQQSPPTVVRTIQVCPDGPSTCLQTAIQVSGGLTRGVTVRNMNFDTLTGAWAVIAIADGELNADISNNYVNFQRARTDDVLSKGFTGTLSRSAGIVTMTLPATPPHNYRVGEIIYITPGEPNFPAGNKRLMSVTPTTLTYAEAGPQPATSGSQTAAIALYDNSAFYVEGDQANISSNIFVSSWDGDFSRLGGQATSAIEVQGGRTTVIANVVRNYANFLNVVASSNGFAEITPNNIIVANNSVNCAITGIVWWPITSRLTRNLSITDNVISVCNVDRGNSFSGSVVPAYVGIAAANNTSEGVENGGDNILISGNVITFQPHDSRDGLNNGFTGGIHLAPRGSLSNVVIEDNIIENSPYEGILVAPSRQLIVPATLANRIISRTGNTVTVTCLATQSCAPNCCTTGTTPETYRHSLAPEQYVYFSPGEPNFPAGFKRVVSATTDTFTYLESTPGSDGFATTSQKFQAAAAHVRIADNLIMDAGSNSSTACILPPCNNFRAALQLGTLGPYPNGYPTYIYDAEILGNDVRDTGTLSLNGVYGFDYEELLGSSNIRHNNRTNTVLTDSGGNLLSSPTNYGVTFY